MISKPSSEWIQITALLFGPTALNEEVSHFEKRKIFILLSTMMTWARSKPLDPVSRT
jgi:adenylate kinase